LENDSLFLSSSELEPVSPPSIRNAPFKAARTDPQKRPQTSPSGGLREKTSPQKKRNFGKNVVQKKPSRRNKTPTASEPSSSDEFDRDSSASHSTSHLSESTCQRPRQIPALPSPRQAIDDPIADVNDFDVYSR
jgi:hypothetical protein